MFPAPAAPSVAAAAAAALTALAVAGVPHVGPEACPPYFRLPPAPARALDLNGAALPEACFNGTLAPHHVFVIGDWGGLVPGPGKEPRPADHRSHHFKSHARRFVVGVDDRAQQRVARQMMLRAVTSKPRYVLNVGDNFYWGGPDQTSRMLQGIRAKCGQPPLENDDTGQWGPLFEDMYRGPGMDGVQWLGVLGNHDYGGFTFTMGWDQSIRYTWAGGLSTGRWVTPAQYWRSKAHYPDFSVDYYFVDSNVFDTFNPDVEMGHNICGLQHNLPHASCAPEGPASVCACPGWFVALWEAQIRWLEEHLSRSTAEWQIVVTHFPPAYGRGDWTHLSQAHGIDLFVTGHTHQQAVLAAGAPGNFLGATTWVLSGGGGGITSEGQPSAFGDDDQYGFMDLHLAKEVLTITAVSHGGQERSVTAVRPRAPDEAYRRAAPPRAPLQAPMPSIGLCGAGGGQAPKARPAHHAFLQWLLQGHRASSHKGLFA